jgi:hypothetical protein
MNGAQYKFIDITEKPLQLNGFGWFETEKKLCRLPQYAIEKTQLSMTGKSTFALHKRRVNKICHKFVINSNKS